MSVRDKRCGRVLNDSRRHLQAHYATTEMYRLRTVTKLYVVISFGFIKDEDNLLLMKYPVSLFNRNIFSVLSVQSSRGDHSPLN